ncbi:RNA polymerase [Bacillus thuringiensis]|uniref:RNA polymerase n=1 Tax=Bacillus thuringiensis TaxID=1428 RepID=UPI00119D9D98|nr:RNA polymerase [Bacillus thuringiensis]
MNSIEESLKNYPIAEFGLRECTIRLLKQNHIHSLYDLFQKTEEDFMKMAFIYQFKNYMGHKRFLKRKELHLLLTKIDEFKSSM